MFETPMSRTQACAIARARTERSRVFREAIHWITHPFG